MWTVAKFSASRQKWYNSLQTDCLEEATQLHWAGWGAFKAEENCTTNIWYELFNIEIHPIFPFGNKASYTFSNYKLMLHIKFQSFI